MLGRVVGLAVFQVEVGLVQEGPRLEVQGDILLFVKELAVLEFQVGAEFIVRTVRVFIAQVVDGADAGCGHQLSHPVFHPITFIAVVKPGNVDDGGAAEVPPAGLHLPVPRVAVDPVAIAVVSGLVLGVPPGIGIDEFRLQRQPGHEPFAEANAEIGRDGPQERAVFGIITPESMRPGRPEDEPVLAERIGNDFEGIIAFFLDEHLFRIGHQDRVPVHFPIVLVLVVHLGGQRKRGEHSQGDQPLFQKLIHIVFVFFLSPFCWHSTAI